MRLAILGTGNVAQTLARRLSETGHEVTFGSRDPASRTGLNAPVTSLAGIQHPPRHMSMSAAQTSGQGQGAAS